MSEPLQTIIIGAGQFGLAVSYWLSRLDHPHLVLDAAARPGGAWQTRWDSFTLVTPNWSLRMPGAPYAGDDPDGFMPRDEIAGYMEAYARDFSLPVRCGVQVTTLEPGPGHGYTLTTSDGELRAANVVVATGFQSRPKIPAISRGLPATLNQLHTHAYRNPAALGDGAVLVVGTGQSGCQIAEELRAAGRDVYLSVSGVGRVPRRYRGKDIIHWMDATGFLDHTVATAPVPPHLARVPHVSGTQGGHDLSLHRFARDGIRLLGRLKGARGGTLLLGDDLQENLAKVDRFEAAFLAMIDAHIARSGLDAPPESRPIERDAYDAPDIRELDLDAAGIRHLIWATGYGHSYDFIRLPVTDEHGFPIQQSGVSDHPGLYFIGSTFLRARRSSILLGVPGDSEFIARHIAERPRQSA